MFLRDFAYQLKGNETLMKRNIDAILQKPSRTPDSLLSVLNSIIVLLNLKCTQFSLEVSNLDIQKRVNKRLQISSTDRESYLEPFVGTTFLDHFTYDFSLPQNERFVRSYLLLQCIRECSNFLTALQINYRNE